MIATAIATGGKCSPIELAISLVIYLSGRFFIFSGGDLVKVGDMVDRHLSPLKFILLENMII